MEIKKAVLGPFDDDWALKLSKKKKLWSQS